MNGNAQPWAAALADLILLLHLAVVAFNVAMVPLAWLGAWREWRWVRRRWVRWTHIGLLGLVAVQALAGRLCPLTLWEQSLRERAGQVSYESSFIGHWIGGLLYLNLPGWMFVALYTAWFVLALWTWHRIALHSDCTDRSGSRDR
jgi:hypothetical protein